MSENGICSLFFMCVAGEWMINGEYKIKKNNKLSENIVDK